MWRLQDMWSWYWPNDVVCEPNTTQKIADGIKYSAETAKNNKKILFLLIWEDLTNNNYSNKLKKDTKKNDNVLREKKPSEQMGNYSFKGEPKKVCIFREKGKKTRINNLFTFIFTKKKWIFSSSIMRGKNESTPNIIYFLE